MFNNNKMTDTPITEELLRKIIREELNDLISCNKCKKQLPAWFEVDHKMRLEYGGSNHVDNLEALCRDCHGRKTAMENL